MSEAGKSHKFIFISNFPGPLVHGRREKLDKVNGAIDAGGNTMVAIISVGIRIHRNKF